MCFLFIQNIFICKLWAATPPGMIVTGGIVLACAGANLVEQATHYKSHQHDETVMNEMIHKFTEKTNECISQGQDDVVQPPKHDLEQ